MSLIRYNPWSLLDDFFEDHFPKREVERWTPAVDIKEEATQYLIHADLPGVDVKNIDISMENNILTIKGERTTKTKESKKGYTRIERFAGSFMRRFTLPTDAECDKIEASAENGVLEIKIPKKASTASSKRIEVKIKA